MKSLSEVIQKKPILIYSGFPYKTLVSSEFILMSSLKYNSKNKFLLLTIAR